MSDEAIENEIQAKGLTAPRLTPAHIDSVIASSSYFTIGDALRALDQPADPCFDTVTVCVLKLNNGHKIIGINEGPVSAANFDAEMGQRLAREKAMDQVWRLEGYLLKQSLHDAACEQALLHGEVV